MVKYSIFISILIAFVGLFLLGKGISGFYFLDFNLPACQSDNDCEDVCCLFYKSNYGVCDIEKNCEAIHDLTQEEYIRMSNLEIEEKEIKGNLFSVVKSHQETPAQQSNFNSMIVGLVLLFLAAMGFIIKEDIKQK